jgi:pyruvate/2-oxoglutarate dehydrogenase complex dihydrolipoamide acyltransferase (E2) component
MTDATPVTVPHESVNDQSMTILSWLAVEGQSVERGQALLVLEGSKATLEVYAPASGILRHTHPEGTEVPVGGELGQILSQEPTRTPAEAIPSPPEPASLVEASPARNGLVNGVSDPLPSPQSEATVSPTADSAVARFSKQARSLLQQRGIDPNCFAGRGLIRADDVRNYLGERETVVLPSKEANAAPPSVREQPSASGGVAGVPYRVEKLSPTKRTEIVYLQSAHEQTLPSLVTMAVPTRGLRAACQRHPALQGNVAALLVFETSRLLRQYPLFNAFSTAEAVNFYEEIHVGFAVDAGHGLKVPIVHHADRKSLPAIAADMRERLVAYLNDSLSIESLSGGTFTVTDLSGDDVLEFRPLLNRGQSAILGVGAEFFLPGQDVGFFNLILAFDHRVAAGRQAARFLGDLRQRLRHHEDSLRAEGVFGPPRAEPCCSVCQRPFHELRALNAFLTKTVGGDGGESLVCTVCLGGY